MTLRDMRDFSYDERMTTPVREHHSDEGQEARPEGFEPPTFCLGVVGDSESVIEAEQDAVVLDITDRLPPGPAITSHHLAPVVVLR